MTRPPSNLTTAYDKKMAQEIKHFETLFNGRTFYECPESWNRVENHFADCMKATTGFRNLYEYVGHHTKGKASANILGLGSGPCGNEIDGIAPFLKQNGTEMNLTCVDINESCLDLAKEHATTKGVKLTPITADINALELEPDTYDVIVAYASLHHFVDLDRIAGQINIALKKDGIFATVDIPTRNGYMMWDDTYKIVTHLWSILPPQFHFDHTGFDKPTHVEFYPNIDYSKNGFECINSEAILPSLREHLTEIAYVPALSIARRFFDTKFGPNYDFKNILDRSIFDFIMNLDSYYIRSNILRPETFFGAYQRKYHDRQQATG